MEDKEAEATIQVNSTEKEKEEVEIQTKDLKKKKRSSISKMKNVITGKFSPGKAETIQRNVELQIKPTKREKAETWGNSQKKKKMSVRELRELFTQKEKQDPNKSISHGGIKTLQQEEETDDAASVIMNEGSIDDFTDLLEEARDLVPNENSFESEETGGSDPSSLSKDSFAHGGTVEIHPDTLKQLEEATKRLEEEENKKLEEERITNLKGKERKNSGRVVRFNEESDFRRSRGSIYLKKNTNEQEREYSQQNYMKVPLKKLAQLQSDEGFWDLTPALAEILGLTNLPHLLETTQTVKERRLLATSLVLAFLRYFRSEELEYEHLIQQANDWFAKTQRRNVVLPSDSKNTSPSPSQEPQEVRTVSLEDSGAITTKVTTVFSKVHTVSPYTLYRIDIKMGNYEWTVFRSYDQFVELDRNLKIKNLITDETLKKTLPTKQTIESVALTPKEKSELVKELFNSTYSGNDYATLRKGQLQRLAKRKARFSDETPKNLLDSRAEMMDEWLTAVLTEPKVLQSTEKFLDSFLAPTQVGDIDYNREQVTVDRLQNEKLRAFKAKFSRARATSVRLSGGINSNTPPGSNAESPTNTNAPPSPNLPDSHIQTPPMSPSPSLKESSSFSQSDKKPQTANSPSRYTYPPPQSYVPPNKGSVRSTPSLWDRLFSSYEEQKPPEPYSPPAIQTPLEPNFTIDLTDERSKVTWELFTTELAYTRSLEIIVNLFLEPLRSPASPYYGVMSDDEIRDIFPVIDELFKLHNQLVQDIDDCLQENSKQLVGGVFLRYAPFLKMYSQYCTGYSKSNETLKKSLKRLPVSDFLTTACRHPDCNQPDLQSFLIQPVQRLPRIVLLLGDLLKHTPSNHPDYSNTNKSLSQIKELLNIVNKTIEIAEKDFNFWQDPLLLPLMEAHRKGICKGRLFLQNITFVGTSTPVDFSKIGNGGTGGTIRVKSNSISEQPLIQGFTYDCYLFNDIFLISKNQRALEQYPLNAVWVDIQPKSLTIHTPEKNLQFSSVSEEEFKVWSSSLSMAVDFYCKQNKENPQGTRKATFIFVDGSTYTGDLKDGFLHGAGTYYWRNGNVYQGHWTNGHMEGPGVLHYANGDKYDGEWLKGQTHGKGTLSLANGLCFTGIWNKGRKDGMGKLYSQNSQEFISGTWKDNILEGNVEYQTSDGTIFKGMYRNNKKHGPGKLSSGDKEWIYEGEWVNNVREGRGKLITKRGVYQGDFKMGIKHGYGIETSPEGTYKGEWKDGFKHGKGIFKFTNGDTYEGEWREDNFDGEGTFTGTGFTYKGSWKMGIREGEGILTYSNGDSYTGSWKENKRNGRGVGVTSEGTYEGYWINDMRTGEGTFFYKGTPRGKKYYGTWLNNLRHGVGVIIFPDGTKYDGEWKNDMKHGKGTLTDRTGRYVGAFRDDMPHGKGVFTSIVDNSTIEGDWVDGVGPLDRAKDILTLPSLSNYFS